MKTGKTLQELAAEVDRQRNAKRDFVVDTKNIAFRVADKGPHLLFGDQNLAISEIAHNQIAEHTKIPTAYYNRMLEENQGLLATNVDVWFQKYPAPRMVRTLDGKARAFLSDRYRPMDNAELLEAALPTIVDLGVEVVSCEVTEKRFYLKVVDKSIKADLPLGVELGQGHARFDTLSPALVLSNSEVGFGALACQTSIWTHGCTNLMVVSERSARKYHIGGRHELGDDVFQMLSDTSRKLTDAALWSSIKDVVKAAFERAKFDATVEKLKQTTQNRIEGDVVKVVEVTAKKYGLNDTERSSILTHLIKGGDLTQYGLHGAITRTAEDLPNYDRASEFESLGGKIIELNKDDWSELALAA
jgi:hypothetical protein